MELENILEAHQVELDKYDTGTRNGFKLELQRERGALRVGRIKDFDKWGNSTEITFEVWQKKGLRQLNRWLGANHG